MAGLPPKKSQTAGNTDWQNTNKGSVAKSKGSNTPNAPIGPVTTTQVQGAMAKLAQKKQMMKKKTRKRVAARLKAMSAGGK